MNSLFIEKLSSLFDNIVIKIVVVKTIDDEFCLYFLYLSTPFFISVGILAFIHLLDHKVWLAVVVLKLFFHSSLSNHISKLLIYQ